MQITLKKLTLSVYTSTGTRNSIQQKKNKIKNKVPIGLYNLVGTLYFYVVGTLFISLLFCWIEFRVPVIPPITTHIPIPTKKGLKGY